MRKMLVAALALLVLALPLSAQADSFQAYQRQVKKSTPLVFSFEHTDPDVTVRAHAWWGSATSDVSLSVSGPSSCTAPAGFPLTCTAGRAVGTYTVTVSMQSGQARDVSLVVSG